jgi:hypothetical protein
MGEAPRAELREHRELRYRKVRGREALETLPNGRAKHTFRLAELVGVCKGEAVRTIEVVFDGQNVHAYPAEDK